MSMQGTAATDLTDAAHSVGDLARRQFLKSAGKFAVVVPPTMTLLLSTTMSSPAIAVSGIGVDNPGGGGGGGGDDPSGGGGDGGGGSSSGGGGSNPGGGGDNPGGGGGSNPGGGDSLGGGGGGNPGGGGGDNTGGGGGTPVVVNVINNASGTKATESRRSEGGMNIVDVVIEQVEATIAGNISQGRGPVPDALSSTFGLSRIGS